MLLNQFHGNFRSKTLGFGKIKSVFRDVKWCFNASWGLKGLNALVNFSAHTCLQLQYLHLYLQCTCEYNTLCETEAHHAPWDQTVWFLFSFIPFVVFILHTHVRRRSNRRNKTGHSQIRLFACKAVWKVQPKYIL